MQLLWNLSAIMLSLFIFNSYSLKQNGWIFSTAIPNREARSGITASGMLYTYKNMLSLLIFKYNSMAEYIQSINQIFGAQKKSQPIDLILTWTRKPAKLNLRWLHDADDASGRCFPETKLWWRHVCRYCGRVYKKMSSRLATTANKHW